MDIRNELIRLAHSNPETRKHIVPILRKVASVGIHSYYKMLEGQQTEMATFVSDQEKALQALKVAQSNAKFAATNALHDAFLKALNAKTGIQWKSNRKPTLQFFSKQKGVVLSVDQSFQDKQAWVLYTGQYQSSGEKETFKADTPGQFGSGVAKALKALEAKDPAVGMDQDASYLKVFQNMVKRVFGNVSMSDISRMNYKYKGGRDPGVSVLFNGDKVNLREYGRTPLPKSIDAWSMAEWLDSKGAKKARL
jgi:hypothetical protein